VNGPVIKALVAKDVKLYFRDKFFGIMTVITLAMFIALYLVMPKRIDETLEIGIYAPLETGFFGLITEESGLVIRSEKSEEDLKKAIKNNEYYLGISFPEDIRKTLLSGNKSRIFIYYSSEIPAEMEEIFPVLIGEMINRMSGYGLDLEQIEIVLGPDRGGRQIPYRDRLLPLFALAILIMETFGLANLITSEMEAGTVQALLSSPMNVVDFFAGKGISGIMLAFSQTVLLILATGSLTGHVSLILTVLFLSSAMVTGIAFLIASISKDMMSVVAWGTLLIIVFSIPGIDILFPGLASGWIRIIPSFYAVDSLHRTFNFGIGWGGNLVNIVVLVGLNALFISMGIAVLKRKMT